MTRAVWRKRLKVIGLVSCLMMLALWVFSVMFKSSYAPPSGQWSVGTLFGRIVLDAGHVQNPGWRSMPFYPHWKVYAAKMPWTEFANRWLGFGLPVKMITGQLLIPVWLLVVAVGFPTAILCWRDRRRPKSDSCKVCGYNLTGNVSGTCPECGTKYAGLKSSSDASTRGHGETHDS